MFRFIDGILQFEIPTKKTTTTGILTIAVILIARLPSAIWKSYIISTYGDDGEWCSDFHRRRRCRYIIHFRMYGWHLNTK